jgi:uncharacterized protein YjbJ (UPF0337 family)
MVRSTGTFRSRHFGSGGSACDRPSNFAASSSLIGNTNFARSETMGEFTDKIKGAVNNAVGNAKQESDNPETRAEGERQELKGDVQETKGKIKGVINDL